MVSRKKTDRRIEAFKCKVHILRNITTPARFIVKSQGQIKSLYKVTTPTITPSAHT